jgi:hypothetical protein
MESSPKDSKKATPTRKRSKTNDADSASPLSDSEKEINIAEDGEAKKEEAKSPSSPSAKKKKSSKKKEKTPAAAPVVLEDKEEKEEPAASIVSPRNEEKPAKEPAEALVSPRGFTRKRSDTVLSDFEDVLDVADEEGLTDDQVPSSPPPLLSTMQPLASAALSTKAALRLNDPRSSCTHRFTSRR